VLQKLTGVWEEAGEFSLCCHPEQLVDDPILGEDILLGNSFELTFVEHVHGFIALNRPLRCGKRPTPQPWIHAAFHKPMILFHHIVQVFALPEQTPFWEGAVQLEGLECRWVRRVLVHGDHPWGEGMLSRIRIARGTQHEIQRGARGIDGAVEVVPLLLDFDVGFIHAIGIVRDFELRPTPLVQLWRVALDPAKHRGVVDLHTPFLQELFHIAIAQRVAQVPAHGSEDDVGFKVAPFEQ
jgi:hypothetical protein